jgi:hypothetical protein
MGAACRAEPQVRLRGHYMFGSPAACRIRLSRVKRFARCVFLTELVLKPKFPNNAMGPNAGFHKIKTRSPAY